MQIQRIIETKRDGKKLSENDISTIVREFTSGKVPDYQMSAFLMASYVRGLDSDEIFWLTQSMIQSGETIDLSDIERITVDKHSTGGVGDKTTLVVVPMLAACGLSVSKMSGRGLGFTGGTLDKLESIPGFNTSLKIYELKQQLINIGAVIAGQTVDIVPADKKIYALRDVTATVDSIPLIAASIMSKKIACGAEIIFLDVKTGSGAFMQSIDDAHKLAETMIDIGKRFGKKTAAAITAIHSKLPKQSKPLKDMALMILDIYV